MSTVMVELPQSERAIKAMATTMRNGLTLLGDGYKVRPVHSEDDMPRYVVTGPDGQRYVVTYDAGHERYSCTCGAHTHLGVCKHLVAVHMHKSEIDGHA